MLQIKANTDKLRNKTTTIFYILIPSEVDQRIVVTLFFTAMLNLKNILNHCVIYYTDFILQTLTLRL